jgi:hypothetical protein
MEAFFMAELTAEEFASANARGGAWIRGPRAESAHYDAGRDRVILRLTTGVELGFAPRGVEGLQHAASMRGLAGRIKLN